MKICFILDFGIENFRNSLINLMSISGLGERKTDNTVYGPTKCNISKTFKVAN